MLVYQRLCGISHLAMLDDIVAGMQSNPSLRLKKYLAGDRFRTDPEPTRLVRLPSSKLQGKRNGGTLLCFRELDNSFF